MAFPKCDKSALIHDCNHNAFSGKTKGHFVIF